MAWSTELNLNFPKVGNDERRPLHTSLEFGSSRAACSLHQLQLKTTAEEQQVASRKKMGQMEKRAGKG